MKDRPELRRGWAFFNKEEILVRGRKKTQKVLSWEEFFQHTKD